MYSLNSLRMPSMSSAVLSSANVHDLQALAGGSPWWANTVHHVITSPSHLTNDGEQVKVCLACFSGATWQILPASGCDQDCTGVKS